jgi:putative SOS response-associated peptidase YedK
MCGRYTLRARGEALARLFDLAEVPVIAERYNVAPAQPVAVVREDAAGPRTLALLRWGLVPSWVPTGDVEQGPGATGGLAQPDGLALAARLRAQQAVADDAGKVPARGGGA